MLTREHICIFIACALPKKGEYGHKMSEIKKFPLPKEFTLPEQQNFNLYCYSCGAYCATGRSGVGIKHCPDCPTNPEEFSYAFQLSRVVLTYDSITYHTLFNLFLHWCATKPDKYKALRAQIKRPRNERQEMEQLFS